MNYMTRDFTMPPYMVYPKFLLRIDINETARMIYTILLDRARLSLATEDYIDDYGHVYVFYTIDNLAQTLPFDFRIGRNRGCDRAEHMVSCVQSASRY